MKKIIIIKKHNGLVEPTESTCFNNVQVGWNLNPYCLFPSLTSCKTMFNMFNMFKTAPLLNRELSRNVIIIVKVTKMVAGWGSGGGYVHWARGITRALRPVSRIKT